MTASAQTPTGIAATKHNLSATSTATNRVSAGGTEEICVFCHTPHGAEASAAAPLWNRSITTPATYQRYTNLNSSTLDGSVVPVGSVSLACLSCHDGTQAMNTVINAPGSGSPNGGSLGTFSMLTDNKLGSTISNLGTDLRNDHPIGVQYAGGIGGGLTSATFADKDFRDIQTATIGGTPVWWVDTGGTGRQKTDMILYTRNVPTGDGGTGANAPYVECASCHDPHTTTQTFLRISNAQSAVCLACHIK